MCSNFGKADCCLMFVPEKQAHLMLISEITIKKKGYKTKSVHVYPEGN